MGKIQRIRSVAAADLRTATKDPAQLLVVFMLPIALLLLFSQLRHTNFASTYTNKMQQSSLGIGAWSNSIGSEMIGYTPVIGSGTPVASTDTLTPLTIGINYMPGLLVIGIVAVAFVRLATQLSSDKALGTISRYAMTSLRLHEFFLAKIIGSVTLVLLQLPFMTAIAFTFGWKPRFTWQVPVGFVLTSIVFVSLAFIVSGLSKGSTASAVTYSVFILSILCSTVFFSTSFFPATATIALQATPAMASTEVLREGFGNRLPPQWAWVSLGAWAAATPVVAMKAFRWK